MNDHLPNHSNGQGCMETTGSQTFSTADRLPLRGDVTTILKKPKNSVFSVYYIL